MCGRVLTLTCSASNCQGNSTHSAGMFKFYSFTTVANLLSNSEHVSRRLALHPMAATVAFENVLRQFGEQTNSTLILNRAVLLPEGPLF